MKQAYIIQEAKEIKAYYEKNHKMPTTNKINGVVYSIYTTSYMMANLIVSKYVVKDYPLLHITRYNTTSHKDTISGEKVMTSDYFSMINHFMDYCRSNKRVPSYITTTKSQTKVSFELFTYCLAKIIVYYAENKVNPNYCIFNKSVFSNTNTSSTTVKKAVNQSTSVTKKVTKYVQKNLLEKLGCSGMGQCTSYYCSCNALQQMFYRLTGILVPEKTIAQWAGVTTAGTGHQGIETAVAMFNKKYNKKVKISWKNFSDLGKNQKERFEAVGKMVNNGKAIFFHLCYRLKYGHYETFKSIDLDKEIIIILNSLGNKNSDGSYQGYHENRTFSTQSQYIANMGQKSVCIMEV